MSQQVAERQIIESVDIAAPPERVFDVLRICGIDALLPFVD